jgi:hypothetical protein
MYSEMHCKPDFLFWKLLTLILVMDLPPHLTNGSSFLDLRFIVKLLGLLHMRLLYMRVVVEARRLA